jgi:uncharacterized peroxidase-related enzyme
MTTDSDTTGSTQFLHRAEVTATARAIFDMDIAEDGFVMNVSRLWAYQPDTIIGLFGLLGQIAAGASLTDRQRGILIAACASTLGDSCCSLVWGTRLAGQAGDEFAAGVLTGADAGLSEAERAMAAWARQVARDPNATTAGDVQALRDAGFSEAYIFAITTYVALRIAFSTVNDALGVRPDAQYATLAPAAVRDAVTFGRPLAEAPAP